MIRSHLCRLDVAASLVRLARIGSVLEPVVLQHEVLFGAVGSVRRRGRGGHRLFQGGVYGRRFGSAVFFSFLLLLFSVLTNWTCKCPPCSPATKLRTHLLSGLKSLAEMSHVILAEPAASSVPSSWFSLVMLVEEPGFP